MVYAGQVTHYNSCELYHHGILGMHWGERRYQYDDGSLTPAGRLRYAQDNQNRAQRAYDRASAKYKAAKRDRKRSKFTTMDLAGSKERLEEAREARKSAKRDLKRAGRITDQAFDIKRGSLMDTHKLSKESIDMSARRAKWGIAGAAAGAAIGTHVLAKKSLAKKTALAGTQFDDYLQRVKSHNFRVDYLHAKGLGPDDPILIERRAKADQAFSKLNLTNKSINTTKKLRTAGYVAIAGLALGGLAYVGYKKHQAKKSLKAHNKAVKKDLKRGMAFESNID